MPNDPPDSPEPDESGILDQLLYPEQTVRNRDHSVAYRSAADIEHGLNLRDVREGKKLQARIQVVPGKPKL